MPSQYWTNVTNKLPGFLMQTSALTLTADLMTRPHWGYGGGIFGFGFGFGYVNPTFMIPSYPIMPTFTMPYYPQTIPQYTPTYQQQYTPQNADGVSNSYSQNLGYNFIMGEDTKFVSNRWQQLDNKANKTSAEEIALRNKYSDFIQNLSKSFIATLDNNKVGNKDGYLSKEEFQSYFVGQYLTDETTDEEINKLKQDSDKIFDMIDIANNGKLDWKEIGAFMSMADSAVNEKYDGTITADEKKAVLKEFLSGNPNTQSFLKQSYLNLYT